QRRGSVHRGEGDEVAGQAGRGGSGQDPADCRQGSRRAVGAGEGHAESVRVLLHASVGGCFSRVCPSLRDRYGLAKNASERPTGISDFIGTIAVSTASPTRRTNSKWLPLWLASTKPTETLDLTIRLR